VFTAAFFFIGVGEDQIIFYCENQFSVRQMWGGGGVGVGLVKVTFSVFLKNTFWKI